MRRFSVRRERHCVANVNSGWVGSGDADVGFVAIMRGCAIIAAKPTPHVGFVAVVGGPEIGATKPASVEGAFRRTNELAIDSCDVRPLYGAFRRTDEWPADEVRRNTPSDGTRHSL
jgi:hypothetical protein